MSLVTVNGVPVDGLDVAGDFFVRLFVGAGENNYVFTVEDSSGQMATTSLMLVGDGRPAGTVDFATLSDVSGSFKPVYARTSFDDADNILFADIAIENTGQYPADAPLFVAIANVGDPSVRVLQARRARRPTARPTTISPAW